MNEEDVSDARDNFNGDLVSVFATGAPTSSLPKERVLVNGGATGSHKAKLVTERGNHQQQMHACKLQASKSGALSYNPSQIASLKQL